MTKRLSVLERAYEIAQSGTCSSVHEIRDMLKREWYSVEQVYGRSLCSELNRMCKAASGIETVAPSPKPRKLTGAEVRESHLRGTALRLARQRGATETQAQPND
jgi:hypothetical protein